MQRARGYRLATIGTLAAISLISIGVEAQTLPKQVQADIIYAQISEAIRLNKASDALVAITQYRALGVAVPPRLLFVEAKLAALSNDVIRADTALSEYLRLVNSSDASYAEAIKLYPQVHSQADGLRVLEAERIAARQAEQEKAAARAKMEAEKAEQMRLSSLTPQQRLAEENIKKCNDARTSLEYATQFHKFADEGTRKSGSVWKPGFKEASIGLIRGYEKEVKTYCR